MKVEMKPIEYKGNKVFCVYATEAFLLVCKEEGKGRFKIPNEGQIKVEKDKYCTYV